MIATLRAARIDVNIARYAIATAYQDYLRAAVGPSAVLHRLYPRDFWIPARLRPGERSPTGGR